ncbi:MAG TPA: methyltransferase [Azospirillum sp.]
MSRRLAQRAGGRDAEIAGVAADVLAEARPQGRVLVASDHVGTVERAVWDGGAEVVAWHRFAYDGGPARAWPEDGVFDAAVLRLPRSWPAFSMKLHAIAARLPAGAPLWIYGGNDEGITSAPKRLEGLVEEVGTVAVKRRARVLRTVRTGEAARGDLDDWRETVALQMPDGTAFDLVSYPGLFAHGRLDAGTACLLQVLPEVPAGGAVLDFGCGAGVIARLVRERVADAKLTLLDVDSVALHAARINVPDAACVLSDGWTALDPRARFDLILSNPPLHRGKEEDFGALDALVRGAKERLKRGGALVAVAQRTAGIGPLFQKAFGAADLLLETPQFQVWRGRAG